MNKHGRVLISAYACEPHKGSEPGVGWNWSKQIAEFAEVWVVTRANNRNVIEEELKRSSNSNLHFVYYDVPKRHSFWKNKIKGLYGYYLLWQIGAYRISKKLHRQIRFNVVHHLTFGNIWLPSFLLFLKVPLIWGPIGGGEQVPKVFRKYFHLKARIKECGRDLFSSILKFNPFFKSICSKANVIITKTNDTARKIPASYSAKIITTTDVAANHGIIEKQITNKDDIRIIIVGSLCPWRGFDLIIKAFAHVVQKYKNTKLLVLGEGAERKRLQAVCNKIHLSDKVLFLGHTSREKYVECMLTSDIFVNPCLKEGGVTVLFDALTFSLPVICLDIAGVSEIISDECGIKIKPINPEQTIKELADALLKLAKDSELRRKMGEAGRRRVMEYYTWEKKGEFIKKVYEQVLNGKIG